MTAVAQRVLERLAAQASEEIGGPIFAGAMPRDRTILSRCAIPHQFSVDLLPILDPALSPAEAAATLARLTRLRSVIPAPDGYALHDLARAALFASWLQPQNREELRLVSEHLVGYFERLLSETTGVERDTVWRRWLFHLFAVDEARACSELERRFEECRRQLRFTAADHLLRLAREFETVLDPARLALIGYLEGKLAADRGEPDKASLAFRATICDRHAPAVLVARAWNRLGLVLDERQRWSDAAAAFDESLKILRNENEIGEAARVLHNLGYVYRDTGDLDHAELFFAESVRLATEAGNRDIVAAARNALGTVFQRSGELSKAMVELKSALKELDELPFDRARVLNNLGIVSLEMGELDASEQFFYDSYTIKKAGDDKLGQAYTLMNLSRLYRMNERRADAEGAVSEAATLFEQAFDWFGAGEAYMNLARLSAPMNSVATYTAGGKALEAFQRSGSQEALTDAQIEIGFLWQKPSRFGPWFWLSLCAAAIVAGIVALAIFLLVLLFQDLTKPTPRYHSADNRDTLLIYEIGQPARDVMLSA